MGKRRFPHREGKLWPFVSLAKIRRLKTMNKGQGKGPETTKWIGYL